MKHNLWDDQCRKKNPFKVPEGYFDNFTDRVMEQIPESDVQVKAKEAEAQPEAVQTASRISFYTRIKPYLYLAATFCGLYFGIHVFKYQSNKIQESRNEITAQQEKATTERDQYIDDFCYYANVDHEDIYAYATTTE